MCKLFVVSIAVGFSQRNEFFINVLALAPSTIGNVAKANTLLQPVSVG